MIYNQQSDRDLSLFSKYSFTDAVRKAPEDLSKSVESLNDDVLLTCDTEATVKSLVAKHMILVPTLDVESITTSQREVDLSRGEPRGYQLLATEVAFSIPFRGDRDVFHCRPSSYSLSPPSAEINPEAIVIRIVRTDHDPVAYRQEFDQTLAKVQDYLSRLRNDCAALESTLQRVARDKLAARKTKRSNDRGLLESLGYPQAGEPK